MKMFLANSSTGVPSLMKPHIFKAAIGGYYFCTSLSLKAGSGKNPVDAYLDYLVKNGIKYVKR